MSKVFYQFFLSNNTISSKYNSFSSYFECYPLAQHMFSPTFKHFQQVKTQRLIIGEKLIPKYFLSFQKKFTLSVKLQNTVTFVLSLNIPLTPHAFFEYWNSIPCVSTPKANTWLKNNIKLFSQFSRKICTEYKIVESSEDFKG